MSVWDTYDTRIESIGGNRREASRKRELRYLDRRIRNSLSYQTVKVDGHDREVVVIDTDILNEKLVYSMVEEDFDLGALFKFNDCNWLLTEKDHHNHLYTKGKLEQCNYTLRWVDPDDHTIQEQECIVGDGTKYLTGEWEDRKFIVTRGDARITLKITRNERTLKFNRQTRFLIFDKDSRSRMAFTLTKPLTFGNTYNGKGIFAFVCQESALTADDNCDLMVADYYKYFPKDHVVDLSPNILINPSEEDDRGRENWL